ncbi:HD-GYP domain-containing protein [Caenibacillus caldisaponilyticus]|uniref:HD-GYP domain-containing protein n=1 Tax=Caenibacillus caldisaponilyticus TaxID=1674942 RepID=UPI0009884320|nr:HD-GYP domain-containing protein [Caenibacillus caldisaponilyticus]
MKVNRAELVEGCVLAADVYSKAAVPLMKKKTVLTDWHLEVLNAFLIDSVDIEPVLDNGEPFKRRPDRTQSPESGVVEDPLLESFLDAVQKFKGYFQDWQQGKPVDIFSAFNMITQLVHPFLERPDALFGLYRFSKPSGYLYDHSVSVGLISAYLAHKMKHPKRQILEIGLAGLLADCGMAKLPPRLYEKRDVLTHLERRQIEKHTIYGYQMLKDHSAAKEGVLLAVLQHHEREDGSGYPLRLSRENIHPYAKIVAVADTFHALICERPYRKKHSPFSALDLLRHDHFGQLDHKVLSLLADEVANRSVGKKVLLSNDTVGEIVFIYANAPTRPLIRLDDGETFSLLDHRDVYIEEVLP